MKHHASSPIKSSWTKLQNLLDGKENQDYNEFSDTPMMRSENRFSATPEYGVTGKPGRKYKQRPVSATIRRRPPSRNMKASASGAYPRIGSQQELGSAGWKSELIRETTMKRKQVERFSENVILNKAMSQSHRNSIGYQHVIEKKRSFKILERSRVHNQIVPGIASSFLLRIFEAKCKEMGIPIIAEQQKRFFDMCQKWCQNRKFVIRESNLGPEAAKIISEMIQTHLSLAQIDIRKNAIGDRGIREIGKALSRTQHIVHLDVSSNDIGQEGAKAFFCHLSKNRSITSVDMSSHEGLHRNRLGSGGAQPLHKLLQENDVLTFLNLSGTSLGTEGIFFLGLGLENNSTLMGLDISNNDIGAMGIETLSKVLVTCAIRSLNLSRNKLGDQGAEHLSKIFPNKMTTLQVSKLDLSVNEMTPSGANKILEGLRKNTYMEEVILDKNNFGDITSLAYCLKDNIILQSLSLQSCNIGPIGALHISDGLRKNGTLSTLSLASNPIEDDGATEIGESLSANKKLITLDLSSCKIGDIGGKQLGLGLRSNISLKNLSLKDNSLGMDAGQDLCELLVPNKTLQKLQLEMNPMPFRYTKELVKLIDRNLTLFKRELLPQYQQTIDHLQADEGKLEKTQTQISKFLEKTELVEKHLDMANRKREEVREVEGEKYKALEKEFTRIMERQGYLHEKSQKVNEKIAQTQMNSDYEMKTYEHKIEIITQESNRIMKDITIKQEEILKRKSHYQQEIERLKKTLQEALQKKSIADTTLRAFKQQVDHRRARLESGRPDVTSPRSPDETKTTELSSPPSKKGGGLSNSKEKPTGAKKSKRGKGRAKKSNA